MPNIEFFDFTTNSLSGTLPQPVRRLFIALPFFPFVYLVSLAEPLAHYTQSMCCCQFPCKHMNFWSLIGNNFSGTVPKSVSCG